MDLFPRINIIDVPSSTDELGSELTPAEGKELLVIYDAELPFLERVLAAAGYDDPAKQLHTLQRQAGSREKLDLSGLVNRLGIKKVCLFGQDLPSLGLHFTVTPYFPITLAGVTYMICEPAAAIASAKEKGNNKPSRALWGGIKQAFLREKA